MENSYKALHVFQSEEDSQWYWHVKAGDGNIVAVGGEGYESETAAEGGYASASKIIVSLAVAAGTVHYAEGDAAPTDKEAEGEGTGPVDPLAGPPKPDPDAPEEPKAGSY